MRQLKLWAIVAFCTLVASEIGYAFFYGVGGGLSTDIFADPLMVLVYGGSYFGLSVIILWL